MTIKHGLAYGIKTLDLDVIDGILFATVYYEYDTPYERATFMESYMEDVQCLGFDYTIFDDNDCLEIVFTLENFDDFEILKLFSEI